MITAAIETGDIPQLGSSDARLEALQATSDLHFEGIAATALLEYGKPAGKRCNLPVTFFWVLWKDQPACWVSRSVLAKLIGSLIFGDRALEKRMEELQMEKPTGPR